MIAETSTAAILATAVDLAKPEFVVLDLSSGGYPERRRSPRCAGALPFRSFSSTANRGEREARWLQERLPSSRNRGSTRLAGQDLPPVAEPTVTNPYRRGDCAATRHTRTCPARWARPFGSAPYSYLTADLQTRQRRAGHRQGIVLAGS